jgi:hypothetical protein
MIAGAAHASPPRCLTRASISSASASSRTQALITAQRRSSATTSACSAYARRRRRAIASRQPHTRVPGDGCAQVCVRVVQKRANAPAARSASMDALSARRARATTLAHRRRLVQLAASRWLRAARRASYASRRLSGRAVAVCSGAPPTCCARGLDPPRRACARREVVLSRRARYAGHAARQRVTGASTPTRAAGSPATRPPARRHSRAPLVPRRSLLSPARSSRVPAQRRTVLAATVDVLTQTTADTARQLLSRRPCCRRSQLRGHDTQLLADVPLAGRSGFAIEAGGRGHARAAARLQALRAAPAARRMAFSPGRALKAGAGSSRAVGADCSRTRRVALHADWHPARRGKTAHESPAGRGGSADIRGAAELALEARSRFAVAAEGADDPGFQIGLHRAPTPKRGEGHSASPPLSVGPWSPRRQSRSPRRAVAHQHRRRPELT